MNKILPTLCAALLLAACQSPQPAADTQTSDAAQSCHRRMCTMQYEPVCATIDYNGQLKQHTFGNSCAVCSDLGKIVAVKKGSCQAD